MFKPRQNSVLVPVYPGDGNSLDISVKTIPSPEQQGYGIPPVNLTVATRVNIKVTVTIMTEIEPVTSLRVIVPKNVKSPDSSVYMTPSPGHEMVDLNILHFITH